MGIGDYILIGAVAAALGAAIGHTIKKRRRGDYGCGGCMGDCSACMHASCLGERKGDRGAQNAASTDVGGSQAGDTKNK